MFAQQKIAKPVYLIPILVVLGVLALSAADPVAAGIPFGAGVLSAIVLTAIACLSYFAGHGSGQAALLALQERIASLAKGDYNFPALDGAEAAMAASAAGNLETLRQNGMEQAALQGKMREAREDERRRLRSFETHVKEFQGVMGSLAGVLSEQVDQLRRNASTLSEAAETATFEAANAATVSGTAATNSNAVAAATEQLSCSIREISDQAHRTNSVVEAATEEAARTDKDVGGLANAAEEIGSIVAVIRGIADQTNLLALNATIEAARAGESGRGFAVVAAEVKELSAQTAKATDAIAEQIHSIQSSTGTAVGAIRSVAGKVAEIQAFTGAIAAAVEEQTAAAQEIANNVARAAEASEKAATSSSEVSQVANQTKSESASVANVCTRLASVSQDLSKAVKNFVTAISGDFSSGTRDDAAAHGKTSFEFAEAA